MSAAEQLAARLKGRPPSLRAIVEKAQRRQEDEFARLQREVENGRPMTSLARALFEREKARREARRGGRE